MSIFTHWANSFNSLRLLPRTPPTIIPEDTCVLCDECHHFVSISGFIPHISGHANSCPWCGNTDQEKLKFAAAWIRTPEEQRNHWAGRNRTGRTIAINGGVPKPLPKAVAVPVREEK